MSHTWAFSSKADSPMFFSFLFSFLIFFFKNRYRMCVSHSVVSHSL